MSTDQSGYLCDEIAKIAEGVSAATGGVTELDPWQAQAVKVALIDKKKTPDELIELYSPRVHA